MTLYLVIILNLLDESWKNSTGTFQKIFYPNSPLVYIFFFFFWFISCLSFSIILFFHKYTNSHIHTPSFFFWSILWPAGSHSLIRDQIYAPCSGSINSFFFTKLIFNWDIITLQYCDGFCHTSTWLSHRYTHVSSLLNLPPTSLPIPLP